MKKSAFWLAVISLILWCAARWLSWIFSIYDGDAHLRNHEFERLVVAMGWTMISLLTALIHQVCTARRL